MTDDERLYPRLIAWALLAVCTLAALTRPLFAYDDWWYHLPFSSYLFNIGHGAASFHLDPLLTARWLGFPKAWEWVQGLAWFLSGSLYAVIVPQLILALVYFYCVCRTQRIPPAWLILGFFASPMLLVHFEAVYTDLPAAFCVAIGCFLAVGLLTDAKAADNAATPFPWWRAACVIAAFGLAGNIKYQALLGVWCVCAIVALLCLRVPELPWRFRACVLIVLTTAALLAASSAASNFVRQGNPFYPLEIKLLGKSVFAGPESPDTDAGYPTYLLRGSHAVSFPEPVNFLLSASELDWTMRGIAPWYNIDAVAGKTPRRGAPSRMGGWGAAFVLVNALLLALQVWRRRREPDPQQRLLVTCTVLLVLATAVLPRAHELRYWLYIPLLVLPVNLRYLNRSPHRALVPGVLLALMAYGVAETVLSPESDLLTARRLSRAALRADMPQQITQSLGATGRYCDPADDDLFRYSEAVTGVPGVLSRVAQDCAAVTRIHGVSSVTSQARSTNQAAAMSAITMEPPRTTPIR
jgi:hypothetical protein